MGKVCVAGCERARRSTTTQRDACRRSAASVVARGRLRSRSTARPARCSSASVRRRSSAAAATSRPSFSARLMELGRRGAPAARARQRRHARTTRAVARALRRRGHRPLPHRAHVLRGRPHRRRARDDPRRRRRRAARARSRSSCRCSARTSPASSARWTGCPVTIRLLDPPLHEFLPHDDARDQRELADEARRRRRARCARDATPLHESNPMLGHRGCRLGITYPEIYRDAGARDLRGGLRASQRERRQGRCPRS